MRERERSRSPAGDKRDSYSRRDYGYSRGDRKERDYRGRDQGRRGDRRGRGGRDRGDGGRGDRDRGDRDRDFNSRSRDYDSGASTHSGVSNEEFYRTKTERNYDNSIFIGNIPFDCSARDVEDIFQNKFDIIKADIVTNRGQSRGMATVEFSNKNAVREAISLFDRSEFNGRQIFVRQDYPPPDKKKDFSRREDSRRDDSRRDDSRNDSRRDDYGDRRGGRERRSREDFGSERKKREREAPRPGTEIFVGNLPFSVNWQASFEGLDERCW